MVANSQRKLQICVDSALCRIAQSRNSVLCSIAGSRNSLLYGIARCRLPAVPHSAESTTKDFDLNFTLGGIAQS
jgi:hypothetical protein